jgi:hypothetical protein
MKHETETRVWAVAGALGSMALGVALIPLRALTSASNLAFVFLAFTIVVAELGGRSAALVTAVVAAMSLNFFLTEPYLTMTISKSDDVVAFAALAACGLIAAAFGRRRARWHEAAGRAGLELGVLHRMLERIGQRAPLPEILGELGGAFGLRAVALRAEDGRVLASAPAGTTVPAIPAVRLAPDTLAPSDESRLRFGERGLRLPEGGGRLGLGPAAGGLSLDVWEGSGSGLSVDEARALTIAAWILGLELSRRQAG